MAWLNAGRAAAAARPRAAGSDGTARQPRTGMPASSKIRASSSRPAALAERPRGRKAKTTAGRAAAEFTGEQLEDGSVERERDPGAVARGAVGAECPAMAERREARQRQRQHPVA